MTHLKEASTMIETQVNTQNSKTTWEAEKNIFKYVINTLIKSAIIRSQKQFYRYHYE